MKLLVIAAFIAVVSSRQLSEQNPTDHKEFPWQSGKQYHYEVNSHTLSRLREGHSSGFAFQANFIVRVKSPGHLLAKLENPQHGQFHQRLLNNMAIPDDLKYDSVQNLDKPFEIKFEGGRVQSINLPSSVSVSHENLLKGLISALQVDLSTYHQVHSDQNRYDKEHTQGLFKKMETDITGDCESLYSVSPLPSEWRRELPNFASEESPIEITKSRNYKHCHHRVAYHFGVPEGAEWTGTADKYNEKQFISHGAVSRILVGRQGPIYKAETTSAVHVHPHVYGAQKAEVHSYIRFILISVEQDNADEWQKPANSRLVKTLLYAMTTKHVSLHDQSSSASSEESHEHIKVQFEESQGAARRSHSHESDRSDSYRLSASSSESSSAYINDNTPKMDEPAYAAMYMNSESRGDKTQNPLNVQKLLLDIAQQLQNPGNMPKTDFLGKFTILVRLIASMSTNQLSQTTRGIEVSKSSNDILKSDMWMIYRDAVVQAGTPPAFQQIKTWINSKKIQNVEAAQVLTLLARSLRYPTKEIMTQFFDLAMSPEIQEQKYLNSSALIAATTFIRLGHVNNKTADSYYPTYMYGRLTDRHDRFVLHDILPRLSEKLKQAVEKDERSKAQVYVKAIANLGHREIFKVFIPYLDGTYRVSTYLRVQIISELRYLVDENDKYARAVLYSIMRNTAEVYEVRVAAIQNLFRANPTADMMRVMAQMTNDDPSIHVRAVLKHGIESAATLQDPRYWYLSRNAQAVRNMVTSDNLGDLYSNIVFFDDYNRYDSEDDSYYREMSYIGSQDTLIPKKQRLSLKFNNGWNAKHNMEFSFSSYQDLVNYIRGLMFEPRKSDANQKYSAKKVSELLNIYREQKNTVEGYFYTDAYNQESFITFDEGSLNRLAEDVRQYLNDLEKGVEQHYTKVFNSKQISVMFPIATGVPFIYKYKEPMVIHIQNKMSGIFDNEKKNYKDFSANIANELQLTVAMNIDGSVGFMDTLSNQLASAGVVKKYQIYVPVKLWMEMKSGELNVKVEPLVPDQDVLVAHYSIWPYSALQQKDSLKPISQESSIQLVKRTEKIASVDAKYGQQIGSVFQLQGYSYSKNYKNVERWPLALMKLEEFIAEDDIALTHFNLRYLGKQSKNKIMKLTAVYDEYYNQKQSGDFGSAETTNDVSVNSGSRREEMGKRVSSGINIARTKVVDLSATFGDQQKEEYVFTAAYANSYIDPKVQVAIFYGRNSAEHGNWQVNAVGKLHKPETSRLNFLDALNKNLKTTYEVDVKFGQDSNINFKGHADRSEKYVELLKQQPKTRQCQQALENHQLEPDCYDILVKSQAPNIMKASVTYKNVAPAYSSWISQSYGILKQLTGQFEDHPVQKTADGKIEWDAETSYLSNSFRFTISSPKGVLRLNNIPIPEYSPYMFTFYSPYGIWPGLSHLANYKSNNTYFPFCTMNGEQVTTFSGRRYKYDLSQSWHLVMYQEEQKRGQWGELVMLSRRPSEKQQEIYISLKTETGKDLELEFSPSAIKNNGDVKVKTNSKKISDGEMTTYWDDVAEAPLLEYFTYQDDVLVLNLQNGRLRLMYDGQRYVVATDEYRNTTRGICGQNSGEPRDDYRTPRELLIDRPEYYGASYSLDEEYSDPKTQELKNQANKKAYMIKYKHTKFLNSDEWKQNDFRNNKNEGSPNVYRTRSYQKYEGECKVQQQVQYHESHGQICITTTPIPSCQSQCHGENYKVQSAQVVCKPKADEQFQTYKSQIKQGQNPQVTGVPKIEQYRVPNSCKA